MRSASSVYSDSPAATVARTASSIEAADPVSASVSRVPETTGFVLASAGWSHSNVTPQSSSPRSSANTISVADGRSEQSSRAFHRKDAGVGKNRAMASHDAPDGWWQEFVLAAPARTAKVAVVRADGAPHVAPVWVDLDGDDVVFMTSADTIKGKAIRRDPRVSLCWDDERPPFSFVIVAGTASLSDDPAALLHWGTRIAARYMGAAQADTYGRRNAVPPEMVVRVTPTRIVARVDIAN